MHDSDDQRGSCTARSALVRLAAAGDTHCGFRESNQDVVVVDESLGLFVVLDGMGGAPAGDVAARIARDELINAVRRHCDAHVTDPRKLLALALDQAAAAVYRMAASQARLKGMGTTAVACLFRAPNRAVIGHAGDSRAYLLRDGMLTLLTRDHTSPEVFGYRVVATLDRNLGQSEGVDAEVSELTLAAGDRLLLCSDGLYGCLVPELLRLRLAQGDADEAAQQLVQEALRSDRASDNISAVVIVVAEAET